MTFTGGVKHESAIIDINNSMDVNNKHAHNDTIDTTFKSGGTGARSSIEETQKTTTIRSQKSAAGSVHSRKTQSIRSLRSH